MQLHRGFGPQCVWYVVYVVLNYAHMISLFSCSIDRLQSSNTVLSCGSFSFDFLLLANSTADYKYYTLKLIKTKNVITLDDRIFYNSQFFFFKTSLLLLHMESTFV